MWKIKFLHLLINMLREISYLYSQIKEKYQYLIDMSRIKEVLEMKGIKQNEARREDWKSFSRNTLIYTFAARLVWSNSSKLLKSLVWL